MRILPFDVSGTGSFLPGRRLTSEDIDVRFGRAPGTTRRNTGIASRPVADRESSSEMAVMAARQALAAAAITAEDVDLIISASAVPEQPIPAMAPLIKAGLGLNQSSVFAFDVNASCLSFVAAAEIAARHIATSDAQNVLIVSSEIPSRALPWTEAVDTAALFGDGAAAAVITRGGPNTGLIASHMETWSEGYRHCELPAGGTRFDFQLQRAEFERGAHFRMDGQAAYRLAARVIEPFMARLLNKAGWRLDDVDMVIPHQASWGALEHLVRRLRIPRSKVTNILANHGNQIAASVPMALHHAFRSGRMTAGKKMLVLGTSAGFSIGGLCLQL